MAVSTQTIHDGPRHAVIKITNDGLTAENSAAVVKVDASALSGSSTNLKIKKLTAEVMPTTGIVSVYYDGTTDALAWILNSHSDVKDFTEIGPIPNNATAPTGDISIKTNATGVSYSIIIEVVKGS
jgi:hypothetical protein